MFLDCDVADDGIQHIATVFKKNRSVSDLKLNLEGNGITDQGIESFCKMLEKNKICKTLYLNLSWNKFTYNSGLFFANFLLNNGKVDIYTNNLVYGI